MAAPFQARRGRQFATLLLMAALATLAVPTTAAWSLPDDRAADVRPAWAAWTTAFAPRAFPAFPGDAAAAAVSAVGCALGDITGDGVADLLVLASDPAAGVQRLTALAGPGFEQVVWEKVSSLGQVLQCAPDLDLDGTLDPILRTLGDATGAAAAGAVDQARNQVQQVLSGASGAAMLGRVAADQVTGAAVPVAGAAAGAAQTATSALLPAAAGAAAFLQTSATTAALPLQGLPVPLPVPPLPLDGLTAQLTAAAELQVLDAAGAVVATISIDEAGVNPLALAPLPLTGGLPDVAVLTQALAPVQEAATGVAELALYNADGTLAWATQLPASAGLPILLPQAGDLDLDGVGDLIVSTVQQGVEQVPGAAYQVLSGVDGSLLMASGPAVTGLMAALPLGALPGGAALLEVASVEGASSLALSALDGAGSVLWEVQLDAMARPVNAALDVHTGDITGFTDLTGDAVPDVAVVVEQASGAAGQASGLALQVIDGLSGEIVQDLPLPGVQDVVPVAIGTASQLAAAGQGAADGAGEALTAVGGEVEHVASGATTALLALGTNATHATVALIDPVAGQVEWLATADLPIGADIVSLSATMAGDLDGDGVQDLLVTANADSTGPGATSGSAARGADAADEAGGTPTAVTAVSGRSGETLYAASATPAGDEVVYESGEPAQQSPDEDDEGGNGVPGVGPGVLLAAVVALAMLLRRRAA